MILRKDMHYTISGEGGQVAIETAISFTLTLIFICSIISVIVFYRTDILMQRSVEQASEEMSLLPPTSIVYTDTVSTLVNAFPEIDAGNDKGGEIVSKIASTIIGIDSFSGNTLEEMILEGTAAHLMANNIRAGYIDRNNGSDFFVPDSIDVDLNIPSEHHIMEVEVTYEILTLAGRIQRKIYSTIPLYGDSDLFLNPDKSAGEPEDIWSKDNFTRGDFFREENDSNLPKTFPVIDSFNNGICESVVSVDLTAPSYSSPSKIVERITGQIDELASFNGADVMISGSRYCVSDRDINSRVLTVVIPSNSEESSKNELNSLENYARLRGVILNVVEYGESQRYINNK